jgi:uncharacterized protein YukE
MADLTVSPTALRAAAERVERVVDTLRERADEIELPTHPGPAELLARRYGEVHADHQDALAALVGRLRDDAANLRAAANRYEDTECQNTITLD